MNVALHKTWTQERFFEWAQAQDIRYEFDGFRPDVVVVFEVASSTPRSIHTDRIIKVREYAAVASIRRYVIVESSSAGLTVMGLRGGGEPWMTSVLTIDGILSLPEIGIEIPVAEIYEDIEFSDQDDALT